jgi:hypothetical protein
MIVVGLYEMRMIPPSVCKVPLDLANLPTKGSEFVKGFNPPLLKVINLGFLVMR